MDAGTAFGLTFERRDAQSVVYYDARGNADIIVPHDYQLVPPVRSMQVVYDFGLKHTQALYEVRVRFDPYPWEQVEDCAARNRENPGSCVMADPDTKSPLWAMTMRMNLSGGDRGRLLFFPDAEVQRDFGASWGLTSDEFQITDADFAGPYPFGQIHQMHKDVTGTYTVFHVADAAATHHELNMGAFVIVRFR